ncbi:B-cell receptor CD22-like [Perca fluviatilis]|uniref:B-cell receptor CD22-like n=1 Tax=Perca fluviatilis TaxID=8168 RepID=UPI0019634715|nr:B-cell receptor CD22-like [Perca fluviatilis]
MRGAAMSLTAAVRGFVVFLLSVSVMQGQSDWGVTYPSTPICALERSTVDITCTYRYPSTASHQTIEVQERLWFTKGSNREPVDLKKDSDYTNRVEYHCDEKSCTLRITDLRERDSAEYKFRFITNHTLGGFTGSPGVTLSVTVPDLQVQVTRSWTQGELRCHSSCNVPDNPSYVWYNNGQKMDGETSSSLSVSVEDNGSYSCAVTGYEAYRSPPVYAPKVGPLSLTPTGEIRENSRVNLTCSSDANPAANYTWYKNGKPLNGKAQLVFSSIQSSDSGQYYCTAENQLGKRTSESVFIDVEYAPRFPSVYAEIVEGSSVTLTCSSDANPAANYTWYKENEDSPKASGQIFNITDVRPEHSGNYYCEAQNSRGRQNSTLNLIVVAGNSTTIMHIIWPTVVVLMLIPLLLLSLWASWTQFRKKKTLSSTTKPHEPVELELDSCPDYENISDTAAKTEYPDEQEDLSDSCPVYGNI